MIVVKDKQYRTENGFEARIYATDGCGLTAVHGAYKRMGKWIACQWHIDGTHPSIGPLNLIEVKPRIKREYWANIYDIGISHHYTKEQADMHSNRRIACVKVEIDCEEGEGL